MFVCDKCGECCRNLHNSPIYKDLHDGDGVCRYLDGNICSIYEERPLFCRVDECYEAFYKDTLDYNEYLRLNYKCCKILKLKQNKEE